MSFHAPSILCRDEKLEFSHIMRVPTTCVHPTQETRAIIEDCVVSYKIKKQTEKSNDRNSNLRNRHTIADYGSDGSKPHDPNRFTGEG